MIDQLGDRINPSRMIAFYTSFSRLFMVLGEWKESRKWARKVMVEAGRTSKEGLVLQATLQEMIANFEMEDTDALEACRRDTLKMLAGDDQLRFEERLIKWILNQTGKLQNANMRKGLKALLADLDMEQGRKKSADRIMRAWIDSKVQRQSMESILESRRDNMLAEVMDLQKVPEN
jgi:hypothetical protein